MTKKSSLSTSKDVECVQQPDSRERRRRVSFNAEHRVQVIPLSKSRAKRRIAVAICLYLRRFNIFYLIGVLILSALLSYRSLVRYRQLSAEFERSALIESTSFAAKNSSQPQRGTVGERQKKVESTLLEWSQLCVAFYCLHFAALVAFAISCLLPTDNWPNDGFAPQFSASSAGALLSNGKLSSSLKTECSRRRLRKARLLMRAEELRAATQSPRLLCCLPPWSAVCHLLSALCLLAVSASSAGAAAGFSRVHTGGMLLVYSLFSLVCLPKFRRAIETLRETRRPPEAQRSDGLSLRGAPLSRAADSSAHQTSRAVHSDSQWKGPRKRVDARRVRAAAPVRTRVARRDVTALCVSRLMSNV